MDIAAVELNWFTISTEQDKHIDSKSVVSHGLWPFPSALGRDDYMLIMHDFAALRGGTGALIDIYRRYYSDVERFFHCLSAAWHFRLVPWSAARKQLIRSFGAHQCNVTTSSKRKLIYFANKTAVYIQTRSSLRLLFIYPTCGICYSKPGACFRCWRYRQARATTETAARRCEHYEKIPSPQTLRSLKIGARLVGRACWNVRSCRSMSSYGRELATGSKQVYFPFKLFSISLYVCVCTLPESFFAPNNSFSSETT